MTQVLTRKFALRTLVLVAVLSVTGCARNAYVNDESWRNTN